ncbi:glucose 1-dehydrogenase [Nocardioides marmoriginsengisoli]|uniref:Glucose 1-dehydrogenase n=1 Tax=Nocardioides marmoriginsengisoli TaxID=661483 RepID=A0A3N0CHH1_9ACTN|nr:glucose 1-dehydrogenase [Nocardioides marmoriginsengisoli]RNL62904.1 glucose 1-dehydrogenase [Nocardioides marmoriginsengisoli]
MSHEASAAGRVALVTGGASGIGRATAVRFAAAGARVVIADLQEDLGNAVVAEILAAGGEAAFVRADLTREEDTDGMVDFCVTQYGALNWAFNAAGITGTPAPFHETSLETWRRLIDVDLTSVFLSMRAELRHMVHNGGGAIVNASSIAGLSPTPNLASYNAAKHGVLGLTKSGAKEYSGRVRVNAVLPGATDTPMIRKYMDDNPAIQGEMRAEPGTGHFADPDDIAAAVVWLCSDESRHVSGVSMAVDGGLLLH